MKGRLAKSNNLIVAGAWTGGIKKDFARLRLV